MLWHECAQKERRFFFMLLTSDFGAVNTVLGVVAALSVAWLPRHRFSVWQLFVLLLKSLYFLPQALAQSFMIVFCSHPYERVTKEKIKHPESPWLTFIQIFVITFTPKSLVVSEEKDGKVEVHSIERKESP